MKTPKRLEPLIEDGIIDEVHYRLMSGKEADLFVVTGPGGIRCAKVYKDVVRRGFKQGADYREGRKVRNSRRGRAMARGSSYGREQIEITWQSAEVDALNTLATVGVRVPEPFGCVDGVLMMELIVDAEGDVAPRLSEVTLSRERALADHALLMDYVVRMLCAGVVHGDLSEFNVLLAADGPVIIDLPQAVNAAANNHAKAMLCRDVNNMGSYYGQFAPELLGTNFAEEMWALFEQGDLTPGVVLTGDFAFDTEAPDVGAVVDEIEAVIAEEAERQDRLRLAAEGE